MLVGFRLMVRKLSRTVHISTVCWYFFKQIEFVVQWKSPKIRQSSPTTAQYAYKICLLEKTRNQWWKQRICVIFSKWPFRYRSVKFEKPPLPNFVWIFTCSNTNFKIRQYLLMPATWNAPWISRTTKWRILQEKWIYFSKFSHLIIHT